MLYPPTSAISNGNSDRASAGARCAQSQRRRTAHRSRGCTDDRGSVGGCMEATHGQTRRIRAHRVRAKAPCSARARRPLGRDAEVRHLPGAGQFGRRRSRPTPCIPGHPMHAAMSVPLTVPTKRPGHIGRGAIVPGHSAPISPSKFVIRRSNTPPVVDEDGKLSRSGVAPAGGRRDRSAAMAGRAGLFGGPPLHRWGYHGRSGPTSGLMVVGPLQHRTVWQATARPPHTSTSSNVMTRAVA